LELLLRNTQKESQRKKIALAQEMIYWIFD
jgi:hypothetical protein